MAQAPNSGFSILRKDRVRRLRNLIGSYHRHFVPRRTFGEYILAKHISHLIAQKSIDLVIDVGANEGQFGRMIRNACRYSGQIISFEPQPEAFSELKRNTQNDQRWDVINCAVGNESSTLTLNVMKSSVFSSFLRPKHGLFDDLNTIVSTVDVPVRRLDSLMSHHLESKPKILLKTDTQGYDTHVLAGAGDLLEVVEVLISEVSFIPIYDGAIQDEQMIKLQKDMGFRLSGMYPVSLAKGQAIECDCIMVKSTAVSPGDHIRYSDVFRH